MKILICIDMQNDFLTGSLGSDLTKAVVPNMVNKIKNGNYDRIIFTKDTHYDNYFDTLEGKKLPIEHCICFTDGWEINKDIKDVSSMTDSDIMIIRKETFGYSKWTNIINDNDEIEICGVCTDICVVSNALALRMFYPNMKITVDAKCCAGTSIEAHNAALTVMKSCQIDVVE